MGQLSEHFKDVEVSGGCADDYEDVDRDGDGDADGDCVVYGDVGSSDSGSGRVVEMASIGSALWSW